MENKIKYEVIDDGTFYSVYIPDYDIYFSSRKEKGEEEVRRIANIMVESYHRFYGKK